MASTSYIHNFSGLSPRAIPGLYEIDFSQSEQLIEMLSGDTSLVASFFRTAIHGDLSRKSFSLENHHTINSMRAKLEDLRKASAGHEESFKTIEDFYQTYIDSMSKHAIRTQEQLENKLVSEGGVDVVVVKEMLNHIYGLTEKLPTGIQLISETTEVSPLSLEEREKYHQILVRSGFLTSSFPTIESVVYRPGKIVHDILETNPKVNTLLMGCGLRTVCFDLDVCNDPSSPSWGPSASRSKKEQIIAEHNDRAMTLDIDSAIDPHVLANMMDLEMLREIPDCRIKKISDHSNGYLSLTAFDEEEKRGKREAFTEFHRILKPEGRIELIGTIRAEDAKVFEEIGFIVDTENGVLIKQPAPPVSTLDREPIE